MNVSYTVFSAKILNYKFRWWKTKVFRKFSLVTATKNKILFDLICEFQISWLKFISKNKKEPYKHTHHVNSTLKRRGNDCFHVVSTWNTRGVFVGNLKPLMYHEMRILQHLLQDFWSVSDHFGTLFIKALTINYYDKALRISCLQCYWVRPRL